MNAKKIIVWMLATAIIFGMLPAFTPTVSAAMEAPIIDTANFRVFARGTPILIKEVGGQTQVFLQSDPNTPLFGGQDISVGNWWVHGGWESGNYTANTSVIVESGTINGGIFGGSRDGMITGNTYVNITGGSVANIYGGNRQGSVNGNTNIEISGGNHGWIFGGGWEGTVSGSTNIEINNGSIYMVVGASSAAAGLVGSTNITVNDGTVEYLYGGGIDGSVTGDTNITINDGTVDGMFGGSNAGTIGGDTNITINGGTYVNYHLIYGGGFDGNVSGNTNITINQMNGELSSIVGGGARGSVSGDVSIIMNDGIVMQIYCASFFNPGTVGGEIEVTINGGEIHNGIKELNADGGASGASGVTVTVYVDNAKGHPSTGWITVDLDTAFPNRTITRIINRDIIDLDTFNSVQDIANAINNSLANNSEVTVIGSYIGADTRMNLTIPFGKTVIWEAEYAGSTDNNELIAITGNGTFDVATNGKICISNGMRVINASANSTVNVSGGEVSSTNAGIVAINTAGNVNVSGGTVSATGAADAITASGTVIVSGGTVSATHGRAVRTNHQDAAIEITGGFIFAWGMATNQVVFGATPTYPAGGNGVVVAWNTSTGTGTNTEGTSTGLTVHPSAATATWYTNATSDSGISFANGTNSSFFSVPGVSVVYAPEFLSAATNTEGTQVIVTFDKDMLSSGLDKDDFTVNVNGSPNAVTGIALDGSGASKVILTLTTAVENGQTVTVAYTGSAVKSADGGTLADFTAQSVTNNVASDVCNSHVWGSYTQTTAPDCEHDGIETAYCTNANCDGETTHHITALGHDFAADKVLDAAATCTSDGEESRACLRPGCSARTDITVISALGHNWSDWDTADATTDPIIYERICTRMGCDEFETNSIPNTGCAHDFHEAVTVITPATCLAQGSGTIECTLCPVTLPQTIPVTAHIFGEYAETIPAECEHDGEEEAYCTTPTCTAHNTRIIPALGHDFPNTWTERTAATATTNGLEYRICTRADCTVEETRSILATGVTPSPSPTPRPSTGGSTGGLIGRQVQATPVPSATPVPPNTADDTHEYIHHFILQIGGNTILDLNGNSPDIVMDVPPMIVNGRTLVPLRFLANALGAQVSWNEATRDVTIINGDRILVIPIGETTPELTALGMEVPAQIIDGRTMVPLRFIAEFFGAEVTWNAETRTVEIVY